MVSVAQIAILATGLGLPTTPSNGAHLMPRAGANQVDLLIILMEMPALTRQMVSVARIAILATGLGLPMIPSNGVLLMLIAGAKQVAQIIMTHPLPQTTPMAVPAVT